MKDKGLVSQSAHNQIVPKDIDSMLTDEGFMRYPFDKKYRDLLKAASRQVNN